MTNTYPSKASEIFRVRLKDKNIPFWFPFKCAYLLHATRSHEIYRLFGPAYSVTMTPMLSTLSSMRGVFPQDENKTLPNADYRLVVPIPSATADGHPVAFTASARLERRVAGPAHNALDRPRLLQTYREKLAKWLPPDESLLHLGPNKEDTVSICAICPNALSHMMQLCTPGEAQCNTHLVVPLDTLLRVPVRSPRRTKRQG